MRGRLRALRWRCWLHLHAPRVEAGDELPIDEKLTALELRFVNLGPGWIEKLAASERLGLGAHHSASVAASERLGLGAHHSASVGGGGAQ